MPDAAVNGTVLHYEAVGDGPTCLVMAGWPGVDHAYLRPGLDRLAGSVRLVYYDHRGHGRSARQGVDSLTMEQLADDADALAAHLGEDRPQRPGAGDRVVVLGHYHGASVAQELALRHPDRVAALVLVAATPGDLGMQESLVDALDSAPVPPEVDVVQRVPPGMDEEVAATMQVLAPYFLHRPDGVSEAVFAEAAYTAEAGVRWMQALSWWSAVDRLGRVEVPVLLLTGRHDVFAAPPQAERIRRGVANAKVVVFEESGHVPWIEEPDSFFAVVQDWLADITTGPAAAS